MKKISVWAKGHVAAARYIIIGCLLLLTIAGIVTGILLHELSVTISSFAGYLFIALYLTGILIYPFRFEKRKLGPSLFYMKQKAADFILTASTFLIIVFISNNNFRHIRHFPLLQAAASTMPKDSSAVTYKSIAAFSTSLKDENGNRLKLKERKKLLKTQIHSIRNAKSLSTGGKIALIVLSIVLALGFVACISALACSLSCGGAEAGVILLGLGGSILFAFLLVITIRSITGRRKKKLKDKETQLKTG